MSQPLAWLSTDGKKLLVTRVLRTFAYGYLAVVIALYLARLGFDTIQVGLVLSADEAAKLDELILTSPTKDWSASFYVAESNPGSFDAWGEPVATLEGMEAGTVTVDLEGSEGGAVLIWITNQGDGDEVTIAEARLTGVPE